MKKTVVFDFDGVIHSYTSGWQGESVIPDEPVKGIKEAIKQIREAGYEVVIVSTRCSTSEGLNAVTEYLANNEIIVDRICKEKPPAVVYIDDRAICFDGKGEELLEKIESFKPWYQKSEMPRNKEDEPEAAKDDKAQRFINVAELKQAILLNAIFEDNKSIFKIIDEVPSATNVVDVYCRHCEYWRRNIGFVDSPNGHCFYFNETTNQNDYCSFSQRRNDDAKL